MAGAEATPVAEGAGAGDGTVDVTEGIGGLGGIADGADATPAGFNAEGGLNPEGGVRGARPPGGGERGEPVAGRAAPGIGGSGDFSGAGAALGEELSAVEAAGTGLGGSLSGGSLTGPPGGFGKGELGGDESLTVKK